MATSKMAAALPLLLAVLTNGQKIGNFTPEVHPKLETQVCTTSGGCITQQSLLVTDSLSRSFHALGDESVPCDIFNTTLCPDLATCAQACELEGVEYGSQGVLTAGSALTLRQYLFDGSKFKKVSPRLYLLAEDAQNYEMLRLVNQELTYDVDVSQLGCGMNGALYLSEMEATGNRGDMNPAGATYGTGYCDAQCPNSTFINGMPNMNSSGACCNEMDIWEANSMATALTPHTCSGVASFSCNGDECGRTATGVCDKDGCGINPFRTGSKNFFGPGMTVDTSRPFTVVTQFFTSDGTSQGTLNEIRRVYVQDGREILNAPVAAGKGRASQAVGVVNQEFCTANNASSFLRLGGMEGMGASLSRGMVLIFSLWNSDGDFMNWLDSGNAGPCANTSGDPQQIILDNPDVSVTFSNVRWGDIGSTYNATNGTATKSFVASKVGVSAAMGQSVVSTSVWLTLGAVMGYLLL